MNAGIVRLELVAMLVLGAAVPIVDSLFAQASQAAENHSLTAIEFDPQLGYPVRMDLAGPPDASGSIFASHLQLLP